MTYELAFSYDGYYIGNLFPLTVDGVEFSKTRNSVGGIGFNMSLRKINDWCTARNFDVKRMFTPMRSTIALYQDGAPVHGGWLAQTPDFTLAQSPDAPVSFFFADWLGLTAGASLHPLDIYSGAFNIVAEQYTQQIIDRTAEAGRQWAISIGDSDTLAVVQGTIDSVKTLKDFLLERTDNTTGTGTFDVIFDPFGVMQIRKKYGYDVTESAVFTYPDGGGQYGIKSIQLPAWENYISDYFLTGAGNGYGTGGTAIFSQKSNYATIMNTGYWEGASSESDISVQSTLDAKATSFLKNTDKAFSNPTITIDASPFKMYPHEEGGNLWIGDTVRVKIIEWAAEIMPFDISQDWRIESITAKIDKQGKTEAQLAMMPDA